MIGDILAWIFAAAAIVLLAAAARQRRHMREEYHRELIREFAGEEDAADGEGDLPEQRIRPEEDKGTAESEQDPAEK